MCAVVTAGAVVGPTCGVCAARARRWSTAYRRVPKRCAPKSWGLCVHKDNQSGDFCLLCTEKASSSLQISFIRRCFLLFIVHSSAKTRKPYRPLSGFCPPRREPAQKNGQTADGHTGCRSAVWPLLDRSRRAVSAHCGVSQRHRARGAAGLRLSGRCGR